MTGWRSTANCAGLRWTVDAPEDLVYVTKVWSVLDGIGAGPHSYETIMGVVEALPREAPTELANRGLRVILVFEGRDGAGKGGTIKAITERVSPRVFRVVALSTPSDREKTQVYMQRYVAHFPAAAEVVIFDRSWYNRAGVERVMGFCTPAETERFLELTPGVEKAMTDDGILLLKYWLELSAGEQTRRLKSRM